ncbi:hypothetical protein SDC9_151723 [bioreactor metagenome]|uniref:Uncharacterized protein n=1 Tax=bioreactor metagenome TaxID=1076179 RepID=A0A645ETE2_9ZZZZ
MYIPDLNFGSAPIRLKYLNAMPFILYALQKSCNIISIIYFDLAYGLLGFNGELSVTIKLSTSSYIDADELKTTFLHPSSFSFLNNLIDLATFSV